MTASFRVSADVVAGWKNELSGHRHVKGVDPVLKEVLEALQREEADQHIVLQRHQLFSWAEALRGASARAAGESQRVLARVADEVRSYLGAPAQAPAPGQAQGQGQGQGAAAPQPQAFAAPAPADARWTPAPPVVYATTPAPLMPPAQGTGGARLLSEREFPAEVARLLREARSEILLVSPWTAGLDSLAKEILNLPQGPQVRILSRRPPQDDPEYHRSLQEMRRRGIDVVMSPYIHTRMLVVDGARVILGAASLPPPTLGSRELALAANDPALAAAARDAFVRMLEEARGRP